MVVFSEGITYSLYNVDYVLIEALTNLDKLKEKFLIEEV
jgi:hypothetical protein